MRNLKTYRIFFSVFMFVWGFSCCFISCQKDEISIPSGKMLDEQVIEQDVRVKMNAIGAEENVIKVVITYGEDIVLNKRFCASLTKPKSEDFTIRLGFDNSLVEEYAKKHGIDYKPLLSVFFSYPEGKNLSIYSGQMKSRTKPIRISSKSNFGDVLKPGRYLLPVKDVTISEMKPVYVDITVREKYVNEVPLYTGDDMSFVFYINTAQFDPRLVLDYYMEEFSGEFYAPIGNILNLRKSVINYDEDSKKPYLDMYVDMKYVLENKEKYILPVQESGRKVCLCIEGGGKGIGFCNLTDEQIEYLTSQIVKTVGYYGLDGVNLWDRGSNYGEKGLPKVNTKSYPKFIKRLREKLGNGKLLTLVDYEEPTSYFWDAEATGGIEVGKYVDYAWIDYPVLHDLCPIIDPWHQGMDGVSKDYPRKPILGMNPKKFGCTNGHTRLDSFTVYDDLIKWEKAGLRQSNVFAFEDLRSNLQGKYEMNFVPIEFMTYLKNATSESFVSYQISSGKLYNQDPQSGGYGKWLKDW